MSNKPSSYLNYLPAVYQNLSEEPDNNEDNTFIGDYLKIFEKIFSGLDDNQLQGHKGFEEFLNADFIGNLFYPQFAFLFPKDNTFIPAILHQHKKHEKKIEEDFNQYIGVADPTAIDFEAKFTAWLSEFLDWLASWLALTPLKDWNVDTKRLIIAKIFPLYRIRGTLVGLQQLLDLCIETQYIDKIEVQNESTVEPFKVGINTKLQNKYDEKYPVVGGVKPCYFVINVYLPNYKDSAKTVNFAGVKETITKIKHIVNQEKPVNSYYQLKVYPTMMLGMLFDNNSVKSSVLGCNTVLYQAPIKSSADSSAAIS